MFYSITVYQIFMKLHVLWESLLSLCFLFHTPFLPLSLYAAGVKAQLQLQRACWLAQMLAQQMLSALFTTNPRVTTRSWQMNHLSNVLPQPFPIFENLDLEPKRKCWRIVDCSWVLMFFIIFSSLFLYIIDQKGDEPLFFHVITSFLS